MSTSALEGTYAPAADVLSSELDADIPRSQAVTEILNFIRATEQGISRSQDLPISTRLACELQQTLIAGTPSEDWQTGKVRDTQVLIGPYKGCSVLEATFIPPPPGDELSRGMSDWERWIHSETDLHPVIRVAAAHYQFEALHPFTDGNGRIGRLIAILQLIDYGLLSKPLINPSPYFEARQSLKHVSTTHTVSVQAANHAVARLTEAGILEEVAGRSYNRVFQAPAVLDILFGPAPQPTR